MVGPLHQCPMLWLHGALQTTFPPAEGILASGVGLGLGAGSLTTGYSLGLPTSPLASPRFSMRTGHGSLVLTCSSHTRSPTGHSSPHGASRPTQSQALMWKLMASNPGGHHGVTAGYVPVLVDGLLASFPRHDDSLLETPDPWPVVP